MKHLLKLLLFLLLSSNLLLAQAKKKVACIGDSVTKGYGLPKGKSYPEQLQELLGPEFEVQNFGRNGATLLKKGHNPYLLSEELKAALDFQPDIVIIALGLNDTDPRNWPNYQLDFQKDYSELLSLFWQNNPSVNFFICRMTPIFSGHPRFLSGTRDWYQQIQTQIEDIAKQHKITLIDNHQPLAKRSDLFEDFLHPSSEGALLLAKQISPYLKPLKQPLSIAETLGSHMVLQRNQAIPIHGKAAAAEKLQVEFKGKTYHTQADVLGNWSVQIDPQQAGGPYEMHISAGSENKLLEDILIGEVFLASGQSNMAFQAQQMKGAKSFLEQVQKNTQIRWFKNQQLAETNPVAWTPETLEKVNKLEFFSGNWELLQADNVGRFSAIALSFAQNLQAEEQIPIGIIELAVGGSNIESWIPRESLEKDPLLASYLHNWRNADFIQDFCRQRAAVNLQSATLKTQRHPYEPAYNFEAGLSKWINTPIKGMLWYQGESNAHNLELHEVLFRNFVSAMRHAFNSALPIYTVQLSSINRPSWPMFRESQRQLSREIPGVYMAVSADLGDPNDVHPTDKYPIGLRLANLVKQHAYQKSIHADSPFPVKTTRKGEKLRIEFDSCRQLKTKEKQAARGFQAMDQHGRFFDLADVQIKGKTVVMTIPAGTQGIYYAYQPFTNANLENEDSVPISSFHINLEKQ